MAELDYQQLVAKAKALGIDAHGKKKAVLIEMIEAAETSAGSNDEGSHLGVDLSSGPDFSVGIELPAGDENSDLEQHPKFHKFKRGE